MKTLELITSCKIDSSLVAKSIIDEFPYKKTVVQNNELQLFIGKTPNNFYINYDSALPISDEELCFEPKEYEILPYENAICTPLFYRLDKVVIPVIQTLLKYYPDLYIYDSENDVIEQAKDFIEKMSQ